jgi:hypothetical protein
VTDMAALPRAQKRPAPACSFRLRRDARGRRRGGINRDLHRDPPNENICSMQDRRPHQPRDEAIRAAMRDAGVLAGILEGEFQATYRGPERSEYVRVLTEIVAGLGGSLEAAPIGLAAIFEDRRIKIRFASG